MSHIAVDLKVIEVLAPMVARAASISEDRALAGLVRLWHRCWSTTSDTLSLTQLAGVFGGERIAEVAEVLCADFLERTPDGYRVKGADTYLRITEAKVAGGKTRASGAPRVSGRFTSKSPADRQQTTSRAPAEHQQPPALSPNTEHRTPNTEHREEDLRPLQKPPIQFDLTPPDEATPIEAWAREDFWRWAECKRRKAGLPQERWPNVAKLRDWWADARQAADVAVLQETYLRFGDQPKWQQALPPLPFAAFMSQWNQYLPQRSA